MAKEMTTKGCRKKEKNVAWWAWSDSCTCRCASVATIFVVFLPEQPLGWRRSSGALLQASSSPRGAIRHHVSLVYACGEDETVYW
jgi:hypothetical protein